MRFVRPLSASLLSLALACAGEANSVLQRSDAQATADAETPGDTGEAPSDTPGAAEDTPGPEELPDGLADDTGSEPPGDTGGGAKDTSTPPPDVPVGPPPAWGVPEVLSVGAADRIVLRGRIVTPATVLDGEVLVVGETIACVAESCAGAQGADGATVIQANGLIFPGLIDAHNHTLFDIFDLADWPLDSYYAYHEDWADAPLYEAMRNAYEYMIETAQAGLKCEVQKYSEIKALIGGTTSIVGQPKGTALKCFQSLARSLDGQFNDLPDLATPPWTPATPCTAPASNDHIQTSFNPKVQASYATGVLSNIAECKTWAWHVHAGEAQWDNPDALEEFEILKTRGLDIPQTVIVHGSAFSTPQYQHMADRGMKLIWSPQCNIALQGETVRMELVKDVSGTPITVALGADWSLNGSPNLLAELRYADKHNKNELGNLLTDQELVEMATINAARVLAVEQQLGSIEVGKMADLIIVSGDPEAPQRALITAHPTQISMTMVGGKILYGVPALESAMPAGCEPLDVCGEARTICVAESSSSDKVNQTLADIQGALEAGLTAYDTANGTKYMPLAPLVVCP